MLKNAPPSRGSALMLMPAIFLIVIVLGAIALDLGSRHLRQRELDDVVAGAANDAAGAGLDIDHLRRTGERRLDPALSAAAAQRSAEGSGLPGLTVTSVEMVGPLTVRVGAEITVDPILGSLVGAGPIVLHSTRTATLLEPT